MQTETLEKPAAQIAPVNDVAELIDREIHRKTLAQINVLAREYEIRNPPEVAEFLREHAFLLNLLEEIPAQVRKVFGDGQNLKLEFSFDPEDANYHRLGGGVPAKTVNENSSALLEKFDENWWLANERKSRSKILIDLESGKGVSIGTITANSPKNCAEGKRKR